MPASSSRRASCASPLPETGCPSSNRSTIPAPRSVSRNTRRGDPPITTRPSSCDRVLTSGRSRQPAGTVTGSLAGDLAPAQLQHGERERDAWPPERSGVASEDLVLARVLDPRSAGGAAQLLHLL